MTQHDGLERADTTARIRVAGVGGGGGNAVRAMAGAGLRKVEFLALNTDAQALAQVRNARLVQLGQQTTRGLGTGGDPAVGARAAEESADAIAQALGGADLVFVTLGLGGGTGTGAGPVVARVARRLGALVVGVATLPFAFEGRKRAAAALCGLDALRDEVDTLIVIPNDRLFRVTPSDISLREAFRVADDILRQGVAGLADLITTPGMINLDFADLRTVMAGAGTALLAIGEAEGADRAFNAARLALTNPLLGLEARGARGVVFNVAGGDDLMLAEVQQVAETVAAAAHPDATIIFGAVTDETRAGKLRVTVVATGFADPLTLAGPVQSGGAETVRAQRVALAAVPVASPPGRRADILGAAWTPPAAPPATAPLWPAMEDAPRPPRAVRGLTRPRERPPEPAAQPVPHAAVAGWRFWR